jgi:hypothetical protein
MGGLIAFHSTVGPPRSLSCETSLLSWSSHHDHLFVVFRACFGLPLGAGSRSEGSLRMSISAADSPSDTVAMEAGRSKFAQPWIWSSATISCRQ